jgi:hypothetical protein
MRIIDRLDKYIEIKGINDNQITVNCGLSVGLLGKARLGKSDLGKKTIEKILNFYQDINKTWLLTGEGEMLLDFTKGITGGENLKTDIEFNEIRNELEIFKALLYANKEVKKNVDKFNDISADLTLINGYISHYDAYHKMQIILDLYSRKQIKMDDVKEEFKVNIGLLNEVTSILEPYSEMIKELYDKLHEFDQQNDKIFSIDF